MRKKKNNGNGENESMRGGKKKKGSNGENERRKKKKNPDERERIDKIRSWYIILMQEIQLLMYSTSSDLMSYCSLAKKNSGYS